MTTYGEAVQMGLGANLAVCINNEVLCAGEALATVIMDEEISSIIPNELKSTLTHVLCHLSVIRELSETMDIHYDREISKFDEENLGKLKEVSKEISQLPIIKSLQDIIGMTDEARVARHNANMKAIDKMESGKLN